MEALENKAIPDTSLRVCSSLDLKCSQLLTSTIHQNGWLWWSDHNLRIRQCMRGFTSKSYRRTRSRWPNRSRNSRSWRGTSRKWWSHPKEWLMNSTLEWGSLRKESRYSRRRKESVERPRNSSRNKSMTHSVLSLNLLPKPAESRTSPLEDAS